jgi:hypothetical protein
MQKVIGTKISEDLFLKFQNYCKEKNISTSEALRKILKEKLNRKRGFFYKG